MSDVTYESDVLLVDEEGCKLLLDGGSVRIQTLFSEEDMYVLLIELALHLKDVRGATLASQFPELYG